MRTKVVSDQRGGFRFSGGARLVLALGVVAITAFLSWSMGPQSGGGNGSPVGTNRPKSGPNNVKGLHSWYATNLAYWTSAPFTDLNDLAALTETVSMLVDKRFPGPEFDQDLLVRDLSAFLHALGAANTGEYLERIKRLRRVSADAHGNRDLHEFYRMFSGNPLPQSMDARGLLDLFWVGDSDAISHPQALAGVAEIQVAESKPVPSDASDSRVPLLVQIFPDFSMLQSAETDPWVSPVWQNMPKTTNAITELENVIARHERVLICEVFLAFRTVDGEVVPGGLFLFFSPDERVWQVEGFGNNYTSTLFWPY